MQSYDTDKMFDLIHVLLAAAAQKPHASLCSEASACLCPSHQLIEKAGNIVGTGWVGQVQVARGRDKMINQSSRFRSILGPCVLCRPSSELEPQSKAVARRLEGLRD